MAKNVQRKKAMNIRLSAEEGEALETMANARGMPQVALIRQWIRNEAHGHIVIPMSDVAGMQRQWQAVFGHKIKRRK
jgi:hypothetical protein